MEQQTQAIKPIAAVLFAVMEIDAVALEKLIQQAHACDAHQFHEPAEPFVVSRQALRMLWHFQSKLKSVGVTPAHG